jgi:hypothetical protein
MQLLSISNSEINGFLLLSVIHSYVRAPIYNIMEQVLRNIFFCFVLGRKPLYPTWEMEKFGVFEDGNVM